MVHFTKMNGAGNDFVMIDNRDLGLHLEREQIARICDRHRGVGADGVLLVEPPGNGGDFRMRYYNSNGGEAEMCGNGARCFARFAARLIGRQAPMRFETLAGSIGAELVGEDVRLQMSDPRSLQLNTKLDLEGKVYAVHSIDTGVPHAVVISDDLSSLDIQKLGAALRNHPHFAPRGANANFVMPDGREGIAIRTYERGVEGETLACGRGVVSGAVFFHHLTWYPTPLKL
jgi:diaminopimelate epimerase